MGALRFDVVAGLTAAAVVLPKAMAYAAVAGLPVSVGLYTSLIPMVIYALLGTSRVLSVSSTTTLAILAGTQLGLAVPDGDPAKLVTATATLTALVGAMLVAARLLRLGFVANFISAPVLTGFKAGIGLVIVLDQVPKLLGIHIDKQGFFRDVANVAQSLPQTSPITLAVAVATFAVLIGMSAEWGKAHLRHGALYYSDSISDDAQPGKVTSFPQAVQLKDDEVIALAWVVYRDKEDRDRIGKAVMDDPQLKDSMDPSKMPFDGKRMFWGGFETIVGLAPGQ